MSLNLNDERVGVDIGVVSEFSSSVVKWFLLLNLGIGWVLFWANLVRLHLAMGDFAAATLTIVLSIGPFVMATIWRIAKIVDSDLF